MFIIRLLLFIPLYLTFILGATMALVAWVFLGKQVHRVDLPLEDFFNWLMEVGEK